ncbi:hypothetical protein LINGRAHAP2_LOCUS31993, partial [Linum grandiflorum]
RLLYQLPILYECEAEIPCSKPVAEVSLDVPATVQGQTPVSCSEICDALKDENLRKLILDINSSPDPENELAKAMGTGAFRILADKVFSNVQYAIPEDVRVITVNLFNIQHA